MPHFACYFVATDSFFGDAAKICSEIRPSGDAIISAIICLGWKAPIVWELFGSWEMGPCRSLKKGARSPSGKAKVCKTFIGGSIPPRASKLFPKQIVFSFALRFRRPFMPHVVWNSQSWLACVSTRHQKPQSRDRLCYEKSVLQNFGLPCTLVVQPVNSFSCLLAKDSFWDADCTRLRRIHGNGSGKAAG
jgi:hypothetical protein